MCFFGFSVVFVAHLQTRANRVSASDGAHHAEAPGNRHRTNVRGPTGDRIAACRTRCSIPTTDTPYLEGKQLSKQRCQTGLPKKNRRNLKTLHRLFAYSLDKTF